MTEPLNASLLKHKESCLRELLRTHHSVFVHVNSKAEGVVLPTALMGRPQVALQLGLNLAVPVDDLQIDHRGWSATLSFNRLPSLCVVAWPAVFLMAGDSGTGGFWPQDCPPDAVVDRVGDIEEARGVTPSAPEKRKTLPPGWGVIDGGKR